MYIKFYNIHLFYSVNVGAQEKMLHILFFDIYILYQEDMQVYYIKWIENRVALTRASEQMKQFSQLR